MRSAPTHGGKFRLKEAQILVESMRREGFAVKLRSRRVQFDGFNCGWASVMLTSAQLQQCRCLHDSVQLPSPFDDVKLQKSAARSALMTFREYLRDLCITDYLQGKMVWTDAKIEQDADCELVEKARRSREAMKKYALKAAARLNGEKDVVNLVDDDDTDWDTSLPEGRESGLYFRQEDVTTDDEGVGLTHHALAKPTARKALFDDKDSSPPPPGTSPKRRAKAASSSVTRRSPRTNKRAKKLSVRAGTPVRRSSRTSKAPVSGNPGATTTTRPTRKSSRGASLQSKVRVKRARRVKHKITKYEIVPGSQAQVMLERQRTRRTADAAYEAERDCMERKRQQELRKTRLVTGSLASVNVAGALPNSFGKAPFGCSWLPVIVENVLRDGFQYQVRAKGALIKELIRRESLLAVSNEALQKEISAAPMRTHVPMSLRAYLGTYWMPASGKPTCNCRNGCKTDRCPCKVAGFGCGADCHPTWYKRNKVCKNYKGELD
jgi:hypothetical protein